MPFMRNFQLVWQCI